MIKYLKDLLGLFFPRLCSACGRSLFDHENHLCTTCWLSLPRTRFHLEPDNPVSQTFWGRVPVEKAAACYYYVRGNRTQRLIHSIKYKGDKELGRFLGEKYGAELKAQGFMGAADFLLPVPLHPKKLKTRGYNQSQLIAEGLGKSLELPVNTTLLYRKTATATQTRKSRYSRWQNVEDVFAVRQAEMLEGKHVILVDDVITTGSTIEACAQILMKIPEIQISVLALAYSGH